MHYEVFAAAIAVFLRSGFKKAEVALHYFFLLVFIYQVAIINVITIRDLENHL